MQTIYVYIYILRTTLDKHAPTSLRKVVNNNSFPWFESIRDELFKAKIERRQAKIKLGNIVLAIFKDMYRQAKHKASILVHTAKCQFYAEAIALASSSEELHQIVTTLSNRHSGRILPTIYPSADLPSLFIRQFTIKIETLRAKIASEHAHHLLLGQLLQLFLHLKRVTINRERMHS